MKKRVVNIGLFASPEPSINQKIDVSKIELSKPIKKAVVEVKVLPKRENRISNGELKPLSEEERKLRFPRGAVKLHEIKKKSNLKNSFLQGMLRVREKDQRKLLNIYLELGLSPLEARDVIDDLIYTYGYVKEV